MDRLNKQLQETVAHVKDMLGLTEAKACELVLKALESKSTQQVLFINIQKAAEQDLKTKLTTKKVIC